MTDVSGQIYYFTQSVQKVWPILGYMEWQIVWICPFNQMDRHPIRFFSLNGQTASVTSGLLFSHFPVKVLKWFHSAMKCMLKGVFSTLLWPLLLNWHYTAHITVTVTAWAAYLGRNLFHMDVRYYFQCYMFRIQILYFRKNFFPLGYIDSLIFAIKPSSMGPVIGEFHLPINVINFILQQVHNDGLVRKCWLFYHFRI